MWNMMGAYRTPGEVPSREEMREPMNEQEMYASAWKSITTMLAVMAGCICITVVASSVVEAKGRAESAQYEAARAKAEAERAMWEKMPYPLKEKEAERKPQ